MSHLYFLFWNIKIHSEIISKINLFLYFFSLTKQIFISIIFIFSIFEE